ncbi:stomatin-like protein 1 [Astyanax mexicanus]|uniref:Stomatin like 1 n=1 Tax=Astyanax mexicanus TaxID=7994 RepID=A0A8B9JMD8_ASTMX|nr:stomatin-like protein 1 [Astyanax mexicanus]
MFRKSPGFHYEAVPAGDPGSTPGLYSSPITYGQSQFSSGHSFDYVPRIKDNDFTDKTQGLLSWICNLIVIFLVFVCTLITFPISAWFALKTVPNYQRIVIFRLGRIRPPKGPGVVLVLPLIDQWQRVDLRTRAFNIPPCKVTTKDGGLVSIGADIQFRIWNPVMSVVAVQDLNASTRLTAQNAMTQSLGKKTVREIQTERVKLGEHLGMDINELTKPWGLEVDRVELTLESVLQAPEEPNSGSFIMPPSVPGLEGLAGPIQQLSMHFLGQNTPGPQPVKDTVNFTDEMNTGAPVSTGSSKAEELLAAVSLVLSEDLVRQVGACFQFHISTSSGQTSSYYYVDLTQNGGACGVGEARQPDVSLSMSEQDLMALFQGSLQPFSAYSSGRLRVQGDLNTAMKLETLIKLLKPL